VLCAKGKCYEKYDDTKKYNCDILLHNYIGDDVPPNIIANKTYVILHCDYASLPQEYPFNKDRQYIAVSETVAQGMLTRYGIKCDTIEGLFMRKPEKKRVYRFISAMQPTNTKGITRVHELAKLLKAKDICFQWLLFYDEFVFTANYKPIYPEIIPCGVVSHDVLLQYMRDADYTIQLSENEGFCMAVHESLMMGTPCLVSDIPVFHVIVNGYNGYRLPLDMQGIDLEKILHKIPKGFEYQDRYDEIKVKWKMLFD